MASYKPVSQRGHQQRECQQVHPPLLGQDRPILLPRRERILLRSCRSELPRPALKAPFAQHSNNTGPSRAFRRRSVRRCFERVPHAR